MKKLNYFLILLIIFLLANKISYSQKEIFIKEFQFELKKISDNQYENEYFLTITLNKNSLYKFTVLNHIGDFPGKANIQILDGSQVVATNSVGDKYYEKFMFKCTKTGFYDILINFQDNKTGSSLIKLFLVQ
ncbi:MAG: hypothetical protein A2X13_08115 [Bacteroidetes bacterium GWC2_33_15]|nr:MAG: hypothetical protein A2X10_05170 [Bacteroidetes bacterium GWA2_33_15]OFX52707.1 MAG: hypothetical protein A2X13_08115 [Bacteroidetes bacterium GWC2_33_15]OFX63987.1 MAG: hypothetical protein A2X15_02220 [Bacteroidetes bacterium GWB2_32_14]OFX67328.1 MAG: hypothetical protein A2X14_12195 [Bacteroidetes bacterium GWD2_33_33]HAN18805.1 hypothetical protein [Bacteroidales bacterium]